MFVHSLHRNTVRAYNRGDMNETVQTRVRAALDRIAELNPSLNAFIAVLDADAMAQAKTLDEELSSGRTRGPLHGQPISVKDLIDIKGVGHHRRVARARGACRARRCGSRRAAARRRRGDHRQDATCTSSRWARRATNRRSVPAHNPHDPRPLARRLERRLGRGGCRRHGLGVDRHRHRRLDPNSGRCVRRGRSEADVR